MLERSPHTVARRKSRLRERLARLNTDLRKSIEREPKSQKTEAYRIAVQIAKLNCKIFDSECEYDDLLRELDAVRGNSPKVLTSRCKQVYAQYIKHREERAQRVLKLDLLKFRMSHLHPDGVAPTIALRHKVARFFRKYILLRPRVGQERTLIDTVQALENSPPLTIRSLQSTVQKVSGPIGRSTFDRLVQRLSAAHILEPLKDRSREGNRWGLACIGQVALHRLRRSLNPKTGTLPLNPLPLRCNDEQRRCGNCPWNHLSQSSMS